jgi:hypothetical protein
VCTTVSQTPARAAMRARHQVQAPARPTSPATTVMTACSPWVNSWTCSGGTGEARGRFYDAPQKYRGALGSSCGWDSDGVAMKISDRVPDVSPGLAPGAAYQARQCALRHQMHQAGEHGMLIGVRL